MPISGSPHVNSGKQEEPYHVYKVPVPSGEFKAQMPFRRELAFIRTRQIHCQKERSDDHMKSMEARRQEKGCAVNIVLHGEGRMRIFQSAVITSSFFLSSSA